MDATYIVTKDGLTLMHRIARPPEKGTARRAYVTHSQAQHTQNLRATIEGIAARGWEVHATDLRGHGYSTSERAPLAHMEMNAGWEALVEDLRLGMQTAFEGVPWQDRLILAPNIGALLVLEVLKDWPELARFIVFVTPPPNQPVIMKLARSFIRARSLFHAAEKPDETTLHQLYSFLGARLSDKERLIDVISGDRGITDALMADPYAWPTPTTGYFHEMFRGTQSAWNWPEGRRVAEGTNVLILYGDDDPMTANGAFVAPMKRHLDRMGVDRVDAHCVPKGRAGLVIEEDRLGISGLVQDWIDGTLVAHPAPAPATQDDIAHVTSDVLSQLGLIDYERDLSADELVDLCYHAIDDEERWIEMLYRIAHVIAVDPDLSEQDLERVIAAIMPHYDRSLRLNKQIMHSAALGAVLQNVIDRFHIGMAVVSADMEVSYANDIFLRRFGAIPGVELGPKPDMPDLSKALKSVAGTAFVARCRDARGEALLMVNGEAVGFHFRPMALRQTALQRGGAAGVLVLRSAESRSSAGKSELLQFAYGLTAREAEAALCVVDGMSPNAIAETLGTSIHTIRTHLKKVYEKTGVQGQTELASRLLKGPLGLLAGD